LLTSFYGIGWHPNGEGGNSGDRIQCSAPGLHWVTEPRPGAVELHRRDVLGPQPAPVARIPDQRLLPGGVGGRRLHNVLLNLGPTHTLQPHSDALRIEPSLVGKKNIRTKKANVYPSKYFCRGGGRGLNRNANGAKEERR